MTSKSTPLDTLRHTALRIEDLASYVIDRLLVDHSLDEDHPLIGCLDSIRRLAVQGLAEHIPGISYERGAMRLAHREAARQLYLYDDETPVCLQIDEGGLSWRVFPRLDPELLDARGRVAALDPEFAEIWAQIVADIEGEDG